MDLDSREGKKNC